VEDILDSSAIPAGLHINKAKTIHSSKKRNRQVTGVTLGSDCKPHIPRAFKRRIRGMIHRFAKLSDQERVSLAGMISYVVGHEPTFTNSLVKKYGFETFKTVTELKTLADRQQIHAQGKE
jgi:RNA-directed DNA polymerase